MPNIREMQRRLSQWAMDHPADRYRDLLNLICGPDWLRQAYQNVAQNKGAETPGVDGMTQKEWAKALNTNLEQLRLELQTGTYQPQPCRRVVIPKSNGKTRPLGIPSFRDRIVQEAIRMALEPVFEADFKDCSYGFRPTRSTHDAMAAVRTYMIDGKRMYYVIEGDIEGYFDTIHHKKLMTLLKRRIGDKRILEIIWRFLKAGVMEGDLFKTTSQGAPQGGVLSPLLANVYLHELDLYFHKRFVARTPWEREKCRKHGGTNAGYIRYADDFVVLCNGSIGTVRQLKADIAAFLEDELHLKLSEEKTAITHANKGFEFLGFRFYRGLDRGGKWKPKTAIPKSKVASVKAKIETLTGRERAFLDEAAVVAQLNAVLRGWGNYYRCVPASSTFREVDHYAFWRLVYWYVNKYHWTRPQVLKQRYSRDTGNRRLFAEWDGREARKRVSLFTLTRDIRSRDYFACKKGNPYLLNEIPEWKAGCGESRTSGLEEGM